MFPLQYTEHVLLPCWIKFKKYYYEHTYISVTFHKLKGSSNPFSQSKSTPLSVCLIPRLWNSLWKKIQVFHSYEIYGTMCRYKANGVIQHGARDSVDKSEAVGWCFCRYWGLRAMFLHGMGDHDPIIACTLIDFLFTQLWILVL